MKVTLRKVLLLTLFVLVLTALFVVGANAATLNSTDNADITDDATAVTAGAVARVGDAGGAYYTTLQGAITAANASESGGTITLLADVTISELAETMPISKPITIDGTNATNGKHKISATGAVNLFAVSANFTLQNVHIKYVCTADAGTIISASSFAGVINIKNSELDSDRRGIYLYRASKASQLNISDNSVIVANGSPLAIETGSGSISIKDSYVLCRGTFNYSSSTAVLCYGATSGTPDNSTITVENSTIAAGGGYALHLRRANTVIKLGKDAIVTKNLSDVAGHKLGIGNDCSFYAQQSPSKPKLILDYNAKLEGRNSHDIRFAHSAKSQEIYFGENYTGAIVCRGHEGAVPGTAGKTTDYRFYDTLSDAIKNGYAYILINHNVDLGDQIVSISKNLNFYIANIVDANIQKSNFVPTITSNADVAFSITGTISVSFTGVNITASNVAFAYGDNADANASVVLNNVTLNAATYTTGMNDGDSVTPLLAKIGTLHYATLQDAIDNAVANDTITLVGNVTLEDSIIINKNLTIDGAGYTITSNNDSAFTINDGGKLALNNVNAVGSVLQGNVAGNVTTNSAALATYLADQDNCVVSDPVEGIYTVTGKYVVEFNGTKYTSLTEAVAAVNASENGGTITLISNIFANPTASISITKPLVIDGAKANGGRYTITSSASGINLFAVSSYSFTLKNIVIVHTNAKIIDGTSNTDIRVNNATLVSSGHVIRLYMNGGTLFIENNSVVFSRSGEPVHVQNNSNGSITNCSIVIEESVVASANARVLYVYNFEGSIHFKNGAELINDPNNSKLKELCTLYGATATANREVIYHYGKSGHEPKIYFYGGCTLSTRSNSLIYCTNEYAFTKIKLFFAEDYTGVIYDTNDSGRVLYYRDSLSQAVAARSSGIFYLPSENTLTETLPLTGTVTFVTDHIFDSNKDGVVNRATITYTGTDAAFSLTGAITATFSDVNITSSNVAFAYDNNAETNTAVVLNNVALTAATVTTGMNDGDTITSLVAKIGNTYYTSLELAIANAVDGDTITLLCDFTESLTGVIAIKKSIIIDGTNPNGGKYKITFTSTVNDVFAPTNHFTLQNVDIDSTSGATLISTSTADVKVTVKNSTVITSTRFLWTAGNIILLIDNSTLVAKNASTIYVGDSTPHFTIKDSHVTSGVNGDTGIIDSQNSNAIIDLKGTTILDLNSSYLAAYEITTHPSASIRMRGNSGTYNSPIITIYDTARLTAGSQGYIYYTGGASLADGGRTDKYVQFASNYNGTTPFIAVGSLTGGGSVNFYDSLEKAIATGCAVVRVGRNVTLDVTIPVSINAKLETAVIVDAETGTVIGGKTYTITYTGTGSAFAVNGGITVTLNNINVNAANGTAFTLNNASASVTLQGVNVTANKVVDGLVKGNTFITYEEAVANATKADYAVEAVAESDTVTYYNVLFAEAAITSNGVTTNYATLAKAIDAASAGDTITLLADSAEALTVNKAITLDLGGKTLNAGLTIETAVTVKNGTVKADTAFTLNDGAALTINNDVTVEATNILGNYGTEKSVTVKAETIANALNDAGFALVNNEGVYTVVTNAPVAVIDGWNYATLEAALTAAKGKTATITLLTDVTIGETAVIDSAVTITGDFTLTSNASVAFEISGALTLNIKKVVVTEAVATFALRATTGSTAFVLTDADASLTLNNTAVEATNVLNGFVATNSVTTTNADTATAINNDGYAMTSATVGETTTYTVNIAGASVTKDGVETNYVSLEAALENVTDGCTITLFADAELTESVAVDKAITINGNGNTITSSADATFSVADAGKLTVNNTVVENSAENGVAFALNAGAELAMLENTSVAEGTTVLGVTAGDTVTVKTDSSAIADSLNNEGFSIGSSDSNFEITSTAPEAAINGKNYATLAEAVANAAAGDTVVVLLDTTLASAITIAKDLTIDLGGKTVTATAGNAFEITAGNVSFTNGTIVAANCAIVVRGGELTIKDGFYTAATAVYVKGGTVTIEGGEFTGNGDANAYVSGSDAIATGDAFVIEVCSDTAPVVNIKDGTFTSINAKTVASYAADTYTAVQEIVSGGRFKGVSNLDDALYKFGYSIGATDSLGYTAVKESNYVSYIERDGVKYGFESLADAVANAAAGETIVLIKNVVTNGTVIVNTNLTIQGDTYSYVGNFEVNASLTLINVSIHTTGSAFTLGANAVLALGADVVVNPADAILSGYSGQTITVSEKAIADSLNTAGYALTFDGNVYTVVSYSPVATLNGWNYATLQAAIAAANAGNGGTITLLKDITDLTISAAFDINKSITINGNGHKITATSSKHLFN
ncbi:MAG: hypothetical protein J6B09_06335, partial [Clostridia bacterium]|nr:hypothetical protein [Clostridia bacterium]